jgi:hypothetical protein
MQKRKVRLHALKCCLFGKYRHCPQHRRLPTPRYGAAIRHIGRLVPGKQRTGMKADLRVAPRQFGGEMWQRQVRAALARIPASR